MVRDFFEKQKNALKTGFDKFCRHIFQKYVAEMYKILPCPYSEDVDCSYFSNTESAKTKRREIMKNYLEHPDRISNEYKSSLLKMEMPYTLIGILNEILGMVKNMNALYDSGNVDTVLGGTNKNLRENKDLINKIYYKAKEGYLSYENFVQMEEFFEKVVRDIFRYLLSCGRKRIENCKSMAEVALIEESLLKACEREGIPGSVLAVDDLASNFDMVDLGVSSIFTMAVFGTEAMRTQRMIDVRIEVVKILKEHTAALIREQDAKSKNKPGIYINGSKDFEEYVKKNKNCYERILAKIAAFIVDDYSHFDLILTAAGVFVQQARIGKRVEISDLIPYEKIEMFDNKTLLFDGATYKNPILNMSEMMKVVNQINAMEK